MCLKILRNFILTLIVLSTCTIQLAWTQPGSSDCFNAISVCQNTYNQAVANSGEGNNPLEITPAISCLGGEANSAWYIFTAGASGNLNFLITPNVLTDDYDWAVYDLTGASCADIATNAALQISCNFSGTGGTTGPNGGSGLSSQGAAGTPFNAVIPVLAGGTYVLCVNNFTGSTNGYSLDFSNSTTSIIDVQPPALDTVSAPGCGSDTINVQFSENVLCNSVSPSDFNIVGPAGSGPYTVTAVTSVNCANGGTFDNSYTLTVSPSLGGTSAVCFQVQLVGPVQDNCGNVSANATELYCIQPLSAVANALPPTICVGQNTTLNTNLSQVIPPYNFNWTTGGVFVSNSPNPVVSPPVTTTYDVTITNPAGCVANTSVTVNVIPPLNVTVYASPQTICDGQCSILSTNYSNQPGYITNWLPVGGGSSITVCPGDTTTFTATVITPLGCAGTGSTVLNVNPVPTSNFSVTSQSICQNSTITVLYTGTASANSGFVWDFDGGTVTPANITGPGPYTVSWSSTGNHPITLQVNQNGCLSPVSTNVVTVKQIPTSDFTYPTNICEDVCNQIVYTGISDTLTAQYNWNFDGGVLCNPATGQGPYEVSWSTPGTYNVCLNVTDNGCVAQQVCHQLNVLPAPTACIATVGDSCLATSCYNFSYCGTPNVDAYYWSMPGGVPATAANPNPLCIHYNNAGPQTVWMYVMDDGCLSDTAFVNFNVIPDPVANFSASSGAACQGSCMSFTYNGPSVSPLQSYNWNFGGSASPQFSTNDTVSCVTFSDSGFVTVQLIVCNEHCCDTMYQTIYVNPTPVVSAGPDKAFCQGDGPIQLDGVLIPGNGIPTFTYNWWCNTAPACGINMVGTTTPLVNPSSTPTTYYFQATDGNGCKSNIDSTVVTIKPKPIVDAGPDQSRCGAPSSPGVTLSANVTNGVPGPYTYSWFCNSNNGNCGGLLGWDTLQTTHVFPPVTTIYTAVVTAANGCSSDVNTLDTVSTVIVTVNPIPNVEAGPYANICKGQSYVMQGFATGAGPNYTYSWTPNDPQSGLANVGNPNTNAAPMFTQLYTLSATSNGCTGTDTMTINVHTLPTASINPPVDDICQGDSVKVQGLADGDPTGTIYSYHWTTAAGTTTGISSPNQAVTWLHPTTTTTYNLNINSTYCAGFVDDIQITVKPTPIANIITTDTIVCPGAIVEINAEYNFIGTPVGSPVIFEWSPSGETVLEPFLGPIMTTTVYTLTTSIAGQCATTDKIVIQVPPFNAATITADTTNICANGSTTLHASGGILNPYYDWVSALYMDDTTIQNPIVSPNVTTTYTVIVSEAGCQDTANITINVIPTPVADYYATNTVGCDAMEVNFYESATNELAYIWNFGDNSPVSNLANPSHLFAAAGQYPVSLTVIGAGGCRDSIINKTVTISTNTFAGFTSNPLTGDSLYLPSAATVSFIDTSSAAISWIWDFGDGNTSTSQNPQHTYTLPGTYNVTLTVTNQDGCTSTVLHAPYIVVDPALFAPNTFTPNGDGSHDLWVLNYQGTERLEVSIYDRWGQTVFQTVGTEKSWDGKDLKGKTCSDGVYFYTIRVGKKVYNGNVLIVR